MKQSNNNTQPVVEQVKCYIRTFTFEDGTSQTFHSICDGKNYSTDFSALGQLTDDFIAQQNPSKKLVGVVDTIHLVNKP